MGRRPARDMNQAPKHNAQHKSLKAGSVHGAIDGITLSGTVAGKACKLTIDTGSTISIVRPDMLNDIGGTLQPSTSYLRTVTGDIAPIQGYGQLQVGIGNLLVPHEMWVADITDECILGLDFLEKHECRLYIKEGVLVMGQQQIPLTKVVTTELRCCRVIAQETCTVAPWTETIIPG